MRKIDKNKLEERKTIFGLGLFCTIIVFAILLATILVSSGFIYFLIKAEVITLFDRGQFEFRHFITFMFVTSAIVGGIVAALIKGIPLRPFEVLIDKINELAAGNYSTRMEFNKLFKNNPEAKRLTESFNNMAQELQNTEMLRSDFINNFSHEFKTPIVSISGFAKLLRRGNLTEEQKEEYMAIIEEESLRLSYMATNMLNLTKIENQTILTDKTEFNLSEQIRDSILLLENKWEKKNLELHIDFDEFNICANEELLKHVWINLLDNAVKFSPDYGVLDVTIKENNGYLYVSISNNGEKIPEEIQEKIWGKFYQGDESHSSAGNGIGLAIVKSVVELHKGTVDVISDDGLTTFTVSLPK